MGSARKPRMRLQKYGRTYQLRIESADDLAHLPDLSESHWMANSAPVDAFACDKVFLQLVDSDHNSRIRCDEVRSAVAWLLDMLADREDVGADREALRLDHLNLDRPGAREIQSAAERILTNLGNSGAREITLAQVRDTKRILSAAEANGDGIIPPSAAEEPETGQFIEDILATVGGETDAGGGIGVTEAKLAQFLNEAESYLAWHERGAIPDGKERSELMPLGAETAVAYAALETVRSKVDEYFRLCATVAYDAGAAAAFALKLDAADAETLDEKLRAAAVASPRADSVLDLRGALNPAYRSQVLTLRDRTLAPILGGKTNTLAEGEWRRVCDALAAHTAWQAARPDTKTASLGVEKLRQYLEPRFREAVLALVETDKAVAQEIEAIRQVERLVLYQRRLLEFVNNFVSFPALYDPDDRAMFERGTLIMDGRQFTLCVSVTHRAAHAKIARNSRLFILYVQLTQGVTGETREIATGVTSGNKGNLYVGKHGIFMDRENRLWDAVVTQIIENPISFGEALVSPFRRMGTLVQSQIERFAGSGQKLIEQKVTRQAAGIGTAVQTVAQQAPVQAAPRPPSHNARDMLIGGSVAFAALGSALAFITKTLDQVKDPMIIVKVIMLVLLAMILPITINAWIKLRRRDVGALLEACGWAINGHMRLTRIMRGIFTRRPRLPANAGKQRFDSLRGYARAAGKPCKWAGQQAGRVGKDVWEAM